MTDGNNSLVAEKHMEKLADQRELTHKTVSCVKEKWMVRKNQATLYDRRKCNPSTWHIQL